MDFKQLPLTGLSLSAGCRQKFAAWERGHRRLNFGWRTLGQKGNGQFFGYSVLPSFRTL